MSPSSHAQAKRPLLGDNAYQALKHLAAAGLPALITLYFTLAQIWHWPDTAQVMGTLAAINTAAGLLLGVSSYTYHNSDAAFDGEIQVDDSGPKTVGSLVFNRDPEQILNQRTAVLKVTQVPTPDSSPSADAQHLNL
jgi:hypothetical protein